MTHILIIDDDPAIQILLKRTLVNQGYQVTLTSDGVEGLAKAKEIRPAMVICDWLMPRLNGLEVCREIKAIPELSTTFFILLTSLGSVADRVKGLDAGADDFLCKPIEMYELKARVRSGLRLHQLSQDLQLQKQLLEAELAEAAEYVSSLLPEPLSEDHIHVDARFIPSSELGGDSFDYFWLDGQNLAMYLLDVSGHGLKAALPSISVLNLLRSRSLTQVNYHQPSQVLAGLNQVFQMNQRNDKYFTIWYGVYNIKTRQLLYSSGGHPPAILLTNLQPHFIQEQRLKTSGFPVGMFPEAIYHNSSCVIEPNSTLYIFSDGIYEVGGYTQKLLGLEQFLQLLHKYEQLPSPDLDQLLTMIKQQHQHPHFDDDLSIIEVNFN